MTLNCLHKIYTPTDCIMLSTMTFIIKYHNIDKLIKKINSAFNKDSNYPISH